MLYIKGNTEVRVISLSEVSNLSKIPEKELFNKICLIIDSLNSVGKDSFIYFIPEKINEIRTFFVTLNGCNLLYNKLSKKADINFKSNYLKYFDSLQEELNVNNKEKFEDKVYAEDHRVDNYDSILEQEYSVGFRQLRREVNADLKLNLKESEFKEFLKKYNFIRRDTNVFRLSKSSKKNGLGKVVKISSSHRITRSQDRFTYKGKQVIYKRLKKVYGIEE